MTADQLAAPLPVSVHNPATRRDVLKAALGVAACTLFSGGWIKEASALAPAGPHRLAFRNSHTGESFVGVYRVGDRYVPEALDQINHVLRDFRTGESHPIDPRALDIIYAAHKMSGSKQPYEIISGYRSPKTNSYLRRTGGGGVARKSLHMQGQAIDLRLSDVSLRRLRDVGVRLGAGGVGFYPRSNFVHLDSGHFRTW